MTRTLNRSIFFPLLAIALIVPFSGCTDECELASDCLSDEICYNGVCTPALTRLDLCESNADCNAGGGAGFLCVGGRCVLDDNAAPPQCIIRPSCFDVAGRTPIDPQVMTATVGVAPADRGATMNNVVALGQGGASNIVTIVGTNDATTTTICMSINAGTGTCSLIQVAVGPDPAAPTNIYEASTCTVILDNNVGNVLTGEVRGQVVDCTNNSFTAVSAFNVAAQ